MNTLFATYAEAVSGKLMALLVLTAVDIFFGVVLAIRQGRFQWARLADYLDTDILPALAWLAIEALALIPANMIPGQAEIFVPQIVYATVFIKILASVAGHFAALGVLTGPIQRAGVTPTGKEEPQPKEFLG